jgi:hypothetical protein
MNSEQMNNLVTILKNTSEKQRQDIVDILHNLDINHHNNNNIKIFANNIIEKKNEKKCHYVKFLESSSINGLVWAPTQVGKSNATREFIETCFRSNVPVIVSTDNKTDQCEQLFSRIRNDLSGADVKMMKVSDKSFNEEIKQCILNKTNRFVIFCLDNATQIEKLIINITSLFTRHQTEIKQLKRIALIHDEADQLTKDKNTESIHQEQAESHKKWIELVNLINHNMGHIDLKRIFVTATPENCCMLYKIDSPDVIQLEIPPSYTGYKNIEYIPFEDDLDVKQLLQKEVTRIKQSKTFEAILYCIERKIIDGHEELLHDISSYLKCTINTYNGNGITATMRTFSLSKNFETVLKKNNVKYTKNGKYFTIKNLAIRKFYTFCKKIGENCILTIGKDLISRGISYVSEDTIEPITATTMIYKPGTRMHAVGICQTIGRITGCAMPNLQRRLYAPQDVINDYKIYNKNQELYISQINNTNNNTKNNKGLLTKEIIDNIIFDKYKRNIDRNKLQLKMNMRSQYTHQDENTTDNTTDNTRMKQLVDLWWNTNTIISKILKFIYEHENGVTENELKEFLNTNHYSIAWYSDLEQKHKDYIKVFRRNNNITKIKKEALEYIHTKSTTN